MPSRKRFISSLTVAGTSRSSVASASAQPAPTATATPVAATTTTPEAKPVSEIARAQALAMRRFDPHLSDEQIEAIARGVDDGMAAGAALSPNSAPLRNSEEPVTRFTVPGPEARA
jgi:hypothetical protein